METPSDRAHGRRSSLRRALGAGLSFCLCACAQTPARTASAIGDPGRGQALIAADGCGGCHEIPGVRGANGLVGPPLIHMGRRTVLAGLLPNTPTNMIRWVQTPQAVVPGDAMPNMELSDHDARDIAAYLETLG